MNIYSGLFVKHWRTIAVTTISSLVTTNALASPNQLDILGLVMGESEMPQVKLASVDPKKSVGKIVFFDIGGYRIPCAPSFLDKKLAKPFCVTEEKFTKASNIEVHSTLVAGFTNKFGKPYSVARMPVRTRMGVEYENECVTWIDNQGNKLQLFSMSDKIDHGMISFSSKAILKKEAERSSAEDARRKF